MLSINRKEDAMQALLTVDDLTIEFDFGGRRVCAVDSVSFSLGSGETLGIVGESGSGKSLTLLSILGILPPGAGVARGNAWFGGRDILALQGEELRQLRGNDVAMIFQDPMTTLNPLFRVGDQIAEAIASAPSNCSKWWAFPIRNAAPGSIRTNFPAACASAWSSPWPSPTIRRSSSPTSRPPRST
jgi:ABC-type glutathione transport system ATPase component